MEVTVRLFALARQIAARDRVVIELPERATVRDVRRGLSATCPALDGLIDQMLIAVDSEYAGDDTVVSGESEIACIPPVSGGAGGQTGLRLG